MKFNVKVKVEQRLLQHRNTVAFSRRLQVSSDKFYFILLWLPESPFCHGIAVIETGLGSHLGRVPLLHGVFEREPTSSSLGQGGSLDINPETRQYGLEASHLQVELTAQLRKVARPEGDETKGDETKITDKQSQSSLRTPTSHS